MVEITILADNKVIELRPQGLKAEWGFSALIEKDSDLILFDTGQTGIAFENLLLLKKDIPEKIVLSHGHYDHTGGLIEFITSSKNEVKIYVHPDAFLPRIYKGEYIGIPFPKERLEYLATVIEHKDPVKISNNVWALGEIPRKYKTALLADSYVIRDGKKESDKILDDQSLAIKTEKGVILILGCCHSGLENTIEYAQEVAGDEVKYIIGGTHLIAYTDAEIRELAKKLKIEMIAPCHCTGLKAEFLLKELLGDKYKLIGSGSIIKI